MRTTSCRSTELLTTRSETRGRRARFFEQGDTERIQCNLCPRHCRLKPGQRGFCYVRANIDGVGYLTTYGRSSGFAVDPIEKKPLNHVMPGARILSFGTAGCHLGCKFCQNWEISKSRSNDQLASQASPEAIVEWALTTGCEAIAYTYNDPIIFAEYVIDTAALAREAGLLNVAVTSGYITDQARPEFFEYIDAANVDLKSFNNEFYRKITGAALQPVLDTLTWLVHDSDVWVEITTLLISGYNDSDQEIRELTSWVASELGPDVPVHFTAFHPAFRMSDVPATPASTLVRAREIGLDAGLSYVYTGNIRDLSGQSTYCPGCSAVVISRSGYRVDDRSSNGRCPRCGIAVAGLW